MPVGCSITTGFFPESSNKDRVSGWLFPSPSNLVLEVVEARVPSRPSVGGVAAGSIAAERRTVVQRYPGFAEEYVERNKSRKLEQII